MKNSQPLTHGIVHAGFRGLRAFVVRKKGWCSLIENRFLPPHDTIPSNVRCKHRHFVYQPINYNP